MALGHHVELFTAVPYLLVLRVMSVGGHVGLQSFDLVNHAGCARASNIGGGAGLPALSVGYGPSIYYSLQTGEKFSK